MLITNCGSRDSDRKVSKQSARLEDFARFSTRITLEQGWKSTEKLYLSTEPKIYLSESQKVSTMDMKKSTHPC